MTGRNLPVLQNVTLTVTERCNLRCGYCYAPVARGRTMTDEVADCAIDLFARHRDPQAKPSLSFFGGEPFLVAPLMRRAIDRARQRVAGELRVLTTTNGLALGVEGRALCREQRIDLALSVDGDQSSTTRPFADGRPSAPTLLAKLPELFALDAALLARMTVTPDNVSDLASNVRALARLGFRRIVYLPDFDAAWSDEAIETWAREHRRIGTWMLGARGAGKPLPDLPSFRGVEARLRGRSRKKACGAGERIAAIATDGAIYPCYRFVFEEGADECRLGDVKTGRWNDQALARFCGLDPERLRPERRDCASCASRDGCTHFCPATGWLAMRDPSGVPETVCRLMCAQVEAIRAHLAPRPVRRACRTAFAAAAVVLAATSTSAVACGGSVETSTADAGKTDASFDGPGVCPVPVDSSPDMWGGPGVCADIGGWEDAIGPGVCPIPVDSTVEDTSFEDAAFEDSWGPGVCPMSEDTGVFGGICK